MSAKERRDRAIVIAAAYAMNLPIRTIARGTGLSPARVCGILRELKRHCDRYEQTERPRNFLPVARGDVRTN